MNKISCEIYSTVLRQVGLIRSLSHYLSYLQAVQARIFKISRHLMNTVHRGKQLELAVTSSFEIANQKVPYKP
jgi:hypothetical protein